MFCVYQMTKGSGADNSVPTFCQNLSHDFFDKILLKLEVRILLLAEASAKELAGSAHRPRDADQLSQTFSRE